MYAPQLIRGYVQLYQLGNNLKKGKTMKYLYADASSADGVQAMRLEQNDVITDAVKSDMFAEDEKGADMVLMTALANSAWVSGESVSVPSSETDGNVLLEGSSYVVWINAGESIAVKGSIAISW